MVAIYSKDYVKHSCMICVGLLLAHSN